MLFRSLQTPEVAKSENQTYQVTSTSPSASLEDVKKMDFTSILSNSKAIFNKPVDSEGNATTMDKGAFIKIDILGPMNDGYVKVTEASSGKDNFSYTFTTMEGHIEKGVIAFSVSANSDGNLTFSINSTSEINNGTAKVLLNDFTRGQQAASWNEVLTNFVTKTGGKEADRKVTREDAQKKFNGFGGGTPPSWP